jgi:hypothetical protein
MTIDDQQQATAQKLLEDPRFEPAEECWVNVYEDGQIYGGPEEGGWWLNYRRLLSSARFDSRRLAERYIQQTAEEVKKEAEEKKVEAIKMMANLPDQEAWGYPEGYIPQGWSDGGKLVVLIESQHGQTSHYPEPEEFVYG